MLIHSSCYIPYWSAIFSLSSDRLPLERTYTRTDPCCSLLYIETSNICLYTQSGRHRATVGEPPIWQSQQRADASKMASSMT